MTTKRHAEPWAHVEWFAGGLVRVFDGGTEFGQPYRYAIPFRIMEPHIEPVTDPRVVRFLGVSGIPNVPRPSEWRAIRDTLCGLGVQMQMERRTGCGVSRGVRRIRE